MAEDKHKPSGQEARASRGRRRPPPTIDLKATEVAPPEPPPSMPPKPAQAEAAAAPNSAAAPTPEPEAIAEKTPPELREPPGSKAASGSPRPPPITAQWPMLGAAAAAGAIVVVILLLLWGIPRNGGEVGQQAARLATLETTVRELAAREPPPAADAKAVASLTGRVAQLEATRSASAPSAPNPQLEERLSAMEKHIGSLSDAAAALKQHSDTAVAAAESAQRRADAAAAKAETVQSTGAQGAGADRQAIASLSDRMTALERTAQALQSDLAQQKTALAQQQAILAERRDTRADERTVRLAVVAEMLKGAVARGERFRAELDAAKILAADQTALAPLEAFADTGVPTAAALGQRLRAVLPAMRNAAAPQGAADEGFLKRLQVNAERLVRIQPIGEQPGDDAGTILARAEAKLGRGDIAGVLTELNALPPAVRAPAQDWIKAAQARDAAIEASRRFAAAHVGALAGRPD